MDNTYHVITVILKWTQPFRLCRVFVLRFILLFSGCAGSLLLCAGILQQAGAALHRGVWLLLLRSTGSDTQASAAAAPSSRAQAHCGGTRLRCPTAGRVFLPRPRKFPALHRGFLTTRPPRKPHVLLALFVYSGCMAVSYKMTLGHNWVIGLQVCWGIGRFVLHTAAFTPLVQMSAQWTEQANTTSAFFWKWVDPTDPLESTSRPPCQTIISDSDIPILYFDTNSINSKKWEFKYIKVSNLFIKMYF